MPSTPSRAALTLSALVLTISAAARAAPTSFVDESTGIKFEPVQTVNGTTYQCLGAGVRKAFIFVKVYAAEFCVEPGALKPAADYVAGVKAKGGNPSDLAGKLNDDPAFFNSLVEAPGGKLVIMHLVRDITREDLAKAFREAMSKVLPPEKVEKLIAIIPGDPKNNQEVKLSSTGDTLTIDIAGNAKKVDDAQIAQNIWRVWLGKDGVSPSLKESVAKTMAQGL